MSTIFSRFETLPSANHVNSHAKPSLVSRFFDALIDSCLHGVIFLVPLFFSSLSMDVLELNKQTVLVVLASVAGVAWLGKALHEKQIAFARGWIHVATVLFGLGYLLISLVSQDRYMSMVGSLGQMPWAFSTVAALLVLSVVAVHRLHQVSQVYNFVFSFLVSSLFVGIYGVLQMFGIFLLPMEVSHVKTFTSVGSVFSFAVYMTIPLVIASSLAFHGCRNNVCLLGSSKPSGKIARVLLWATIAVSLFALVAVDYWVSWGALLFGTIVTVIIGYLRTKQIGKISKLILPAVLIGISVLFLFVRTPFSSGSLLGFNLNLNLPSEVSPSVLASADIAKASLGDFPLFGTGPGTWIYDYAKYRSQMVNLSPFWSMRFDRGSSFFFTLLATMGVVGIALWLFLIASALLSSVSHLVREKNDDVWYAYLVVFTGWLTLVFTSFFYNFNMAHVFALWFLFGLLGSLAGRRLFVWDGHKSSVVYGVLSTVVFLAFVSGISVMWLTGQRYVADAEFAASVSDYRSGASIEQIIAHIEKARTLNPMSDIYARNLSQAHLIRVSALIKQSTKEENVNAIQNEIKLATDLGMEATRLAPANVDNWSNLGLVYQSIASFTGGADELARKNFAEASKRDPQNPVFLNEIGKLYLYRADAYRTKIDAGDDAAKDETKKNVDENLSLAEKTLKLAITAKSDYLPSRYYLGVVYERQGRLKDSITELENVLKVNNKDFGVAFELSILYYRNSQKSQALELMHQITLIDPKNANAHLYLSAMLEEQGDYKGALNEMKSIQEQHPGNVVVQQRITALSAALQARTAPVVQALPEPLTEEVKSQNDVSPVKN